MKKNKRIYLMLLPTVLVYACISAVPIGYLFFLSLHKTSIYTPGQFTFIGLENYMSILRSSEVWQAIAFTFQFTISAVSIEFVLAFAIALLFHRKIKGIGAARSLLIIPMVIAPVLAAVTWKMAMDSNNGVINYILGLLHIHPINWLADPKTAKASLVIVDIWQSTPYLFFVITSGLQSVPEVYYEAARIDGASRYQLFWNITVPSLKNILMIGLIFRTMGAFRAYDSIYGLTVGGPGNATSNASFYAYKLAFTFDQMGESAALSIVFLAIILLICAGMSNFMGEIWNAKTED
ncbi:MULTISPECIES: sugar ABC transporter permease [Hungatella]|uniref:carbohydrate ABC transporter permease n=1 Tax=Hungatella TaxID=1649459 RepID=UPI002A82CF6D|nr:sugar ABC transporter permease [Hungatella hathewayi]